MQIIVAKLARNWQKAPCYIRKRLGNWPGLTVIGRSGSYEGYPGNWSNMPDYNICPRKLSGQTHIAVRRRLWIRSNTLKELDTGFDFASYSIMYRTILEFVSGSSVMMLLELLTKSIALWLSMTLLVLHF